MPLGKALLRSDPGLRKNEITIRLTPIGACPCIGYMLWMRAGSPAAIVRAEAVSVFAATYGEKRPHCARSQDHAGSFALAACEKPGFYMRWQSRGRTSGRGSRQGAATRYRHHGSDHAEAERDRGNGTDQIGAAENRG